VYYLLITEVLYERPALKKEKKREKEDLSVTLLRRLYANDKCVASDLNHNIVHTRGACIIVIQLWVILSGTKVKIVKQYFRVIDAVGPPCFVRILRRLSLASL
jgi:hypothetical protein